MIQLAVNTDFITGLGDPEPRLRLIAEAGFTHLHWCHQWNTDFMYTKPELDAIRRVLHEMELTLMDIHGSVGPEKNWFSLNEDQRKAGVLLVRNRLEMLKELDGTGVLIMHIPRYKTQNAEPRETTARKFDQLKKSLDELMPVMDHLDAAIAVENMADDTFEIIAQLMKTYPANRLGITYDSGHGNFDVLPALPLLEPLKDRLMALHLHDNDGLSDQHQPPYYGKVDWERLAGIIAASPYPRPLSFEIAMRNTPFYEKERETDQTPENFMRFMTDAYERCVRVNALYEFKRKSVRH